MRETGSGRRRRIVWVIAAVTSSVYMGAVYAALQVFFDRRPWHSTDMAVGGVVALVGFPVLRRLQGGDGFFWPRDESEERGPVQAAITAGLLPSTAGPAQWRPLLENAGEQLRRGRWMAGAMCVAVGALVGGAAMEGNGNAAAAWALAAALVSFAVLPIWHLGRRLRTVHRLMAELERR